MDSTGNLKINETVRVDGGPVGRIFNIFRPLGTYCVYEIKLDSGEMKQVGTD